MSDPKIINPNSAKKLSRRVVMLGVVQLVLAGIICRRIVNLQAIDQEDYQVQADSNRISYGLILPVRGLIVDRNGVVLAQNIQEYWASLVPEDAKSVQQTLDNFSKIIPLSEQALEGIHQKIQANFPFTPVLLADQLTWDQVAEISVNGPALGGVNVEFANQRYYPKGQIFSHVIGYVGLVSEQELERNKEQKSLYIHPKFMTGKTGVENAMEQQLRGQAGYVKYEVNVHGKKIRELDVQPYQTGKNIQLTLDSRLQEYILKRLGDQVSSAIVMDIENGDILALVSNPTFNPNLFVEGISHSEFQYYLNHQHTPLFDRASSGQYPPGSIFKMITALAGLDAGLISSGDTVFCPGFFEFSDQTIHCWKKQGHGVTEIRKSLSESCDVFYYELGLKVGIEAIAKMAKRLGLGQTFELPLPNLNPGLVPNQEWKLSRIGSRWLPGDTVNASIGQGYVSGSVLQLGVMMSRLLSGTKVYPRLVKSLDENPHSNFDPLGLEQSHLDLVIQGLHSTVNDELGTAYKSRIVDPAFRIGGKTGTSQVRKISQEIRELELQDEDLPREHRDHSLFCGYGPLDKPKYVAGVIVEHGGSGSKVAAPIARDILTFVHYGGIPPLNVFPEEVRNEIIEDRNKIEFQQILQPDTDNRKV